MKDELGIEATKKVVSVIIDSAKRLIDMDINGDGTVTKEERQSVIFSTLPTLALVVPDLQNVQNEIKDLDADEVDQLLEHLAGLQILNDDNATLEEFIDKTILWVKYNARYATYAIGFIKDNRSKNAA